MDLSPCAKELNKFNSGNIELGSDLQKLVDFNFPRGHIAVLNERGECLIGNTIIVYLDGYKHFIPNKDEQMLAAIRINPSVSKMKDVAGGKLIPVPQSNTSGLIISPNSINAQYQKAFYSQKYLNRASVGLKKFIHELVSWSERVDIQNSISKYDTRLFVRSKLEYDSKGKWREAGEFRLVTYDIIANYTLNVKNYWTNYLTTTSGSIHLVSPRFSYDRVAYAKEYNIFTTFTDTAYPYSWDATVTGSISQIMDGDAEANRYTNSGNLW